MIDKTLKIILILFLSILCVGLGIVLYILINNNYKYENLKITLFSNNSSKLLESKKIDVVNDIYIDSNISDVYIKNSEDEKIKVELFSDNSKNYSIKLDNNDLKVFMEVDKKISLFSKLSKIVLYVPSSFSNNFYITDTTGDIEIANYKNASFKVKLTTGDISVDKANILDVITKTGDIKINKTNTVKAECKTCDIKIDTVDNSLDLKTTTGDIKINKVDLKENSSIETTTGDVKINSKNDNIYIETESKIGDVKVDNNNRFADYTLHIKVITGDIKVG